MVHRFGSLLCGQIGRCVAWQARSHDMSYHEAMASPSIPGKNRAAHFQRSSQNVPESCDFLR